MPCEVEELTTKEGGKESTLDLPIGVPPLRSLYLYIAGSCNLACRHCWITPTFQPETERNGGRFVKLEHVEKAICEARPLGLHSVKLTGGEPTLHPRFREIVSIVDQAGLEIMIETNGTLIDIDLANFLRERRVGFVSVSLDGANAETHDALRLVQGSYDRAIAGIQILVKAGFRPQVICTLHRVNVSQVAEVVSLAERLGCGSVKFNVLQEMGRGEQFFLEQGMEISETIQISQYVEKELTPFSKLSIYFDIPLAFMPIRRLLSGNVGHCSVLNIMGILPGGEFSLCGIGTTVPELIYGHIEQDDLRQVWSASPGLLSLREIVPAQLEDICGECLHRDLCLGACIANNYHTSGRLSAAYMFCKQAFSQGLFPQSRKKMSGLSKERLTM